MSTAVNSHRLAYISYQARLFDRSSLSRWTQDEVIDEHDLYFILVDQHHAQSAHLTDFSGPIVQCSFCHPGAVEKVLSTALNTD
jgi:hypothetical protein